jgi:hypothetical protein
VPRPPPAAPSRAGHRERRRAWSRRRDVAEKMVRRQAQVVGRWQSCSNYFAAQALGSISRAPQLPIGSGSFTIFLFHGNDRSRCRGRRCSCLGAAAIAPSRSWRPAGRTLLLAKGSICLRPTGCWARAPITIWKAVRVLGPLHKRQDDPCDKRLNRLAGGHPGLEDFDDLRERMPASCSGGAPRGTVIARSAHSAVGHPDGRGQTERNKPRARRCPTGVGISRRGLAGERAFDASHRTRKDLRLMHDMLHGLGHTRAQEAGMGPVSPRSTGHRLHDLCGATEFLPEIHLRLALGSPHGPGSKAGKLPRGLLPDQ